MIKKNAPDFVAFSNSLHKLCAKHGLYFDGVLRVKSGEKWDASSYSIKQDNIADYGYAKDTSGPFFTFNLQQKIVNTQPLARTRAMEIVDKDKLVRHGVKSMADGSMYDSRHAYDESLKRNHMIEVGDMAPTKAPKEIRGDYDVRRELRQAIQQHIG